MGGIIGVVVVVVEVVVVGVNEWLERLEEECSSDLTEATLAVDDDGDIVDGSSLTFSFLVLSTTCMTGCTTSKNMDSPRGQMGSIVSKTTEVRCCCCSPNLTLA